MRPAGITTSSFAPRRPQNPRSSEAFQGEQALLERVFGHQVRLVSRAEQHTELRTDAYFGLLVDERSAALNPAQYVSGLAAAALRAGAIVLEETPVERLTRRAPRWVVRTSRGEIDAADVIVATNGYTSGVTPSLQRTIDAATAAVLRDDE